MHTEHSFNIKLAIEVGIEKAILLKNIHWWILKNAKNGKNFKRGRFWTFNSSKAFAELFPYMASVSIRRWLSELEEDGWIITGNFNRRRNDKTKWYAVGERLNQYCKDNGLDSFNEENLLAQNEQENFEEDLFHAQNEQSFAQNDQPVAQNEQSIAQNEQALPDISTDSKQDVAADVLQNDKLFFEEIKEINLNDDELVKNSVCKMFELSEIQIAFMSAERVRNELIDIRSEISKSYAWRIIIDSFVEVAGMKDDHKSVNYLLAKIKGKKNEFYQAKQKQKASAELLEQSEDNVGDDVKGLELARKEFELRKHLLTPAAVARIERLLEEKRHLTAMAEVWNTKNYK